MKRSKTPTFLLELPLSVDAGQAKRLRVHFEAARCLYNALLGEALKRLRQMRADPAWQEARAIPKTQKQERKQAFSQLREMCQEPASYKGAGLLTRRGSLTSDQSQPPVFSFGRGLTGLRSGRMYRHVWVLHQPRPLRSSIKQVDGVKPVCCSAETAQEH
jgi:hypothetical protein